MEIVVRLSVTPTGSESGQTFSKKVPESQLVQHSAIRSALISRSKFIFAIIGAVVHADYSADLPPEALGQMIQLEFLFTSDDVQNLAGWYIDDVLVTNSAP
jgi:hypothetical protein